MTQADAGVSLKRQRLVHTIAFAFALFAFVVIMERTITPVAGGSDSSGYMNFAQSIAKGELTIEMRVPESISFDQFEPMVFTPLGYRFEEEKGALSPAYPIGLPLLLAPAYLSEDVEHFTKWILILLCGLTLIGIWMIAKNLGLEPEYRHLAVFAFAVSPIYIMSASPVMSDGPSTCLSVWIMYVCTRSGFTRRECIVLGFLFGLAVLIRIPNLLLIVPIVFAAALKRPPWRRYIDFGLGGLPAFVVWTTTNQTMYGNPIASSYGNLGSLFSIQNVLPTWQFYASNLQLNLGLGGTSLLAISGALLLTNRLRGQLLFLLAWSLPTLIFYSFYFHTRSYWWYLRFVLPVLPAASIALALALQWFASRLTSLSWRRFFANYAPVGLVIAAALNSVHLAPKLLHFRVGPSSAVLTKIAHDTKESYPNPFAIVCMQHSGELTYYTDLPIIRWDWLTDRTWTKLSDVAAKNNKPIIALLDPFERENKNSPLQRGPGVWTLEHEPHPGIGLYRYTPP